jgi:16S rRNA (cytosine967-C5)-methyltransferase
LGLGAKEILTSGDGIAARLAAARAIRTVIQEGLFLEDSLAREHSQIPDTRDRSFAHAIAATSLRRKGQIEAILGRFMRQPLSKNSLTNYILLCGVAQLLFMGVDRHAVIDTAVELASRNPGSRRLSGLVNAILRQIDRSRQAILSDMPPALLNLPPWLDKRLRADFGPAVAAEIAEAHTRPADLDLTAGLTGFPEPLLERGTLLPTGTLRIPSTGLAIPNLPGFAEGAWWVQDAAAALPARLFGKIDGMTALDMCSAPGGKTLQLASAGAQVTALDISQKRLDRLLENLERTGLHARCIVADAREYTESERYDLVLLDAPCTATGTIRRHPELPFLRTASDVKPLLILQRELLRKAARLLKPGGQLVYAVCSLLADEGPKQVSAFLNEHRNFSLSPIQPGEAGIPKALINKAGQLRTLPSHKIGNLQGLDGFFACRLTAAAS